jgi:Tol biopolymer transport system component
MNPNGSDVRRLTDTDGNEWWPHISNEGDILIFGRNYPGESRSPRSGHAAWGVSVWEAGSDPVDVTDNQQFQSGPRLSPDGSQILMTSGEGSSAGFQDGLYQMGETNVWVMDRDGSNRTQLTEGGGGSGDWSPDGSEIVFSAPVEGDDGRDIFIMNADGSNVRQLTDHASRNSRPSWSPDGSRIVFDSDRDGDTEIYVIDVDGSNLQQLTNNDADDDFAQWSPDGSAITFTSDRDGNSEIYVMAADGSGQTNISNNEALDIYPSWSELPFSGF